MKYNKGHLLYVKLGNANKNLNHEGKKLPKKIGDVSGAIVTQWEMSYALTFLPYEFNDDELSDLIYEAQSHSRKIELVDDGKCCLVLDENDDIDIAVWDKEYKKIFRKIRNRNPLL